MGVLKEASLVFYEEDTGFSQLYAKALISDICLIPILLNSAQKMNGETFHLNNV